MPSQLSQAIPCRVRPPRLLLAQGMSEPTAVGRSPYVTGRAQHLLQAAARVEVVEVESHYTVMQDEQAASAIRALIGELGMPAG